MIPQIFTLGSIPLNSFGLLIACALVAGSYRLARSFQIEKLPEERAEHYVFIGGIAGLLGARFWYIAENFNQLKGDLFGAMISSAGFTFYGGMIISTVVMWLYCKKDKIPFSTFIDVVGPTMTLGYAIGRLGCQLSGDGDYGVYTDSWLGMSYATGVVPTLHGLKAFPTPLYESFLCLLILWVLTRIELSERWRSIRYARFSVYITLIALERFLVEFLRVNPKLFLGLSQAQIISVAFMVIGCTLLLTKSRALSRCEQSAAA